MVLVIVAVFVFTIGGNVRSSNIIISNMNPTFINFFFITDIRKVVPVVILHSHCRFYKEFGAPGSMSFTTTTVQYTLPPTINI